MHRRDWFSISLALILACSVLAALTADAGVDYFFDSGSIDAVVRGDWSAFFAEQPLMGPLSVLIRAPFAALVFHSSLGTVYLVGVIPCYAALLVLAGLMWSHMAGRPLVERVAVLVVCAGSPIAIRAVHWGHPEELLATALCIGAVLAAGRGRPVLAGLMIGLAFATKQWALIAGVPVLATLPSRRVVFCGVAAGVGVIFMLPMLLGDPDRFLLITRAAGSADPSSVLGQRQGGFLQGHVAPHALWMPLGERHSVGGREFLFMDPTLARLTHPLILLIGLPLTWLAHRRQGGPLPIASALRLLALIFVLRGALDPNDLDYYHVPLMAALAGAAAFGDRRDLMTAVAVGAGLSLAFAQPADSVSVLTERALLVWVMWVAYMATVVPLCVELSRRLYAPGLRASALGLVGSGAAAR